MAKFVFLLPLLFALNSAVIYNSNNKADFPQGYRYNRPAPHYLPPYQETTTQSSSYFPAQTTSTSAGSSQQTWHSSSYDTSPSGLYSDKPFVANLPSFSNRPGSGYDYTQSSTTGYNYMQPQTGDASSGYEYMPSSSSYDYKPSGGYDYMPPQASSSSSSSYKPSSGYASSSASSYKPSTGYNYSPTVTSYLPPTMMNSLSSSETFRPTNSYIPPTSTSSGYDYMQPQSSIPLFEAHNPSGDGYSYTKPQSSTTTSYNPNTSFEQKPSDSYDYADVGNSYDSSSSYQRPNYSSTSTSKYTMPWYSSLNTNREQRFNNNYNAKASSPSNLYLPPKREFQTPYYK